MLTSTSTLKHTEAKEKNSTDTQTNCKMGFNASLQNPFLTAIEVPRHHTAVERSLKLNSNIHNELKDTKVMRNKDCMRRKETDLLSLCMKSTTIITGLSLTIMPTG
mmetsp:Transcript_13467/g.20193  ORF Transcript_13467/g.20193 Transcript_13467/m.20193 type:complete len:106 (-) Transcript_13467:291-608(-)